MNLWNNMASSSMCRSCLYALRLEIKNIPRQTRPILAAQNSSRVYRVQLTSRPFSSRPYVSSAASSLSADSSASEQTESQDSKRLREDAPAFNEAQKAIDVTESLFKECARQADYIVPQAFEREGDIPKNEAGEDVGEGTGWWYENLELTPTFNNWAQVTFLHMYLLTVRLRYLPNKVASIWIQHLHDHFFFEAEHRMTIFHRLTSRAVRNRYLKEIYNQWRGVQGAYDEGLIRGDAVLGAAVWRNVFQANEDVDWRHVALVVAFMRRGLKALDGANDKTIVGGLVKFNNPMSEMPLVEKASAEFQKPFDREDEEEAEKLMKQASSKGN